MIAVIEEVEAIDNDRLLLQSPDLIKPLLEQATNLLKKELNLLKEAFNKDYDYRMKNLQANVQSSYCDQICAEQAVTRLRWQWVHDPTYHR